MRAANYTAPGLIENLSIAMRQIPKLRENECLLKVHYSAINRADTLQRKGLYPPPAGQSDILGLEAVGVIHEVSNSGNSRWKKNDRVMALVSGGGNAEYVAVNENHLIRIPDKMSFREAAAIPEVWLTAFQLIYWISSITQNSDKSIKDTKFLVHAGASGVGTSLIQILKNVLNVDTVFATVGSQDKKEYLENNLQVTRAFNYKTSEEENFPELISKLTLNKGVDVVFDCVGGLYWQKNLDSLNTDGEWILYGTMGGGNVTGDILAKILRKRIHLKSSTLRTRSDEVIDILIKQNFKSIFYKFIHFKV